MTSLVYLRNKTNDRVYVYVNEKVTDKEGRSTYRRRCIGHLDEETGDIIPNTHRSQSPSADIEYIGMSKTIRELSDRIGLSEVLKMKFAEKENTQAIDITNIKKRISTLTTEIKKVKKNHALSKIEDDVYYEVIADLEAERREAECELELASVNLSNLTQYIDDTIAIACNLSSYWSKKDFDICQNIQKLVFPKGVKWDKEERCFRTESVNEVFGDMLCISDSYKNGVEKEKDKSCDLSSLVAGGGLEPPTSGL